MMLLLVLLSLVVSVVNAEEFVCFHCFGNSSEVGQYCSIDNLCTGTSCYFHHLSTGEWSAGCSEEASTSSVLQCELDGIDSKCSCSSDFCNEFDKANNTLRAFWPNETPFSAFTFFLPDALDIYCSECGNISIGGMYKFIPCTEENLCKGNYCVTKRGQNPHSYCGTTWQGNPEERCFKNPGEEEQCVCAMQMCNAVLSPETTAATTSQPTVPPTTGAVGAGTLCKNGLKFSPNAQAVAMGEKLKNIINNGFGGGGKAIEEFNDGIDAHICNYSEDQ